MLSMVNRSSAWWRTQSHTLTTSQGLASWPGQMDKISAWLKTQKVVLQIRLSQSIVLSTSGSSFSQPYLSVWLLSSSWNIWVQLFGMMNGSKTVIKWDQMKQFPDWAGTCTITLPWLWSLYWGCHSGFYSSSTFLGGLHFLPGSSTFHFSSLTLLSFFSSTRRLMQVNAVIGILYAHLNGLL